MVADEILFRLFRDYFKLYLPKMRECSRHTIRSYRTAINSLLDFVKAEKKIGLDEVTLNMLTDKMVVKYLDSLKENGNSASTRALRLTCIKAFFSYAAEVEPTSVFDAGKIAKIEVGKEAKHKLIDYLSEPAIKALLEQPDPTTEKGLRDQFILLMMYDSAARLQEIRSLTLRDIIWDKEVSVTLHGKGNKTRIVPLMKPTVEHLKNYLKVFHPSYDRKENAYTDAPLFYVVQHGRNNPISDSAARNLVCIAAMAAKQDRFARNCPILSIPTLFSTAVPCIYINTAWTCHCFNNGWAMRKLRQRMYTLTLTRSINAKPSKSRLPLIIRYVPKTAPSALLLPMNKR